MIWISVKDRLPEKSGKYRVRTIEGSIAPRVGESWVFGKITHDGFRFLEGDWQRVTHWAEEAQINNPCGHTGFESNICEICGYPNPSKMIASMKQQLKDRECCGNCKYYTAKTPCLLHKKQNAGAYCSDWESDGLTRKDRE